MIWLSVKARLSGLRHQMHPGVLLSPTSGSLSEGYLTHLRGSFSKYIIHSSVLSLVHPSNSLGNFGDASVLPLWCILYSVVEALKRCTYFFYFLRSRDSVPSSPHISCESHLQIPTQRRSLLNRLLHLSRPFILFCQLSSNELQKSSSLCFKQRGRFCWYL